MDERLTSIECQHDDARKRIVAHVYGRLSIAEALRFIETYRVGKYRKYQLLCDVTAATFDLPTSHVVALRDRALQILQSEGPGGAVAIIADTPEVLHVTRLFKDQRASAGRAGAVQVFRTMDDAERWLATGP
jgi:hypothetical protein